MKILNSVQGFNIRGENHNALFHLYQCIAALAKAKKQPGAKAGNSGNPWYGAPKISVGKFRDATLNEFVQNVLRPAPENTVLGFKEIRHKVSDINDAEFIGYVDFILKYFPHSKIVFLTRNSEETSASAWFKKLPKAQVIADIEATNERFSGICQKHDSCFLIDYAEVTENGSRISELFDFLGVTHSPEDIAKVLSVPLNHLKASKVPKKPLQWLLWQIGIRPASVRKKLL